MAKPEIILEIKTYADGVLVNQTAKVVAPDPDWIKISSSNLEISRKLKTF